jgi:hypothetical protein
MGNKLEVAKTGGSVGTQLDSLAKFTSRYRLLSPLKPEINVIFYIYDM